MVDTGIILLDIRQPMLLKQKRKQELNLFWQLFSALPSIALRDGGASRGLSQPPKAAGISRLRDILGLHI